MKNLLVSYGEPLLLTPEAKSNGLAFLLNTFGGSLVATGSNRSTAVAAAATEVVEVAVAEVEVEMGVELSVAKTSIELTKV